ncbi:MAG: amino acid adenylation domain-containing protein [Cyanobacteria bacterium RM1_2_2]|nr:amino acid adenylation domain-containing protein [Cyanobacteria bacterium RM1_2_2]
MNSKQIEDIYPLSPMQQGMLFHSLLAPQSGAYVVQVCFEIHEPLDVDRFEQAWQQVVDRHPVLRTAFVWDNLEQPLQVVGRRVKLPLEQLDCQSLSPDQQQQQLAQLQQQRTQGFPLTKAPLMRLRLVQLQPAVYTVVWSYHHLLLDGWSVPLLLREVLASYRGLRLGTAPPYRCYIAWLQQQDLQQAEQFWRRTLQGFVAPTRLGIDRTAERTETATYQEQQIQLSAQLSAALQRLAQRHQITLNTLVQGVYALLLSRYSGETDIVFGTTCSGRPVDLPNAETMIGLFINTLPMRIKIDPQQHLLDWLQQIQTHQLELRQYEYSSLLDIQRWSDLPRSLPLFESLLIFENYPIAPEMRQQIANLKNIQTTEQTNYPLSLYIVADPVITLRMLYDCERFSTDQMVQMLNRLENLLMSILENPRRRLAELNLLTETEQQQIAVWNQTDIYLPELVYIHQQFEKQAENTPDTIALVYEDEQISYRVLNKTANQLAHYLISLGVKPGTHVGIYLERSPEMLVALLAVLKAGAVYIPLDPAFPEQRLRFMMNDAQVTVLLTQSSLPTLGSQNLITCCLDTLKQTIADHPIANPAIKIASGQIAYILYTSGSTGQPKGVQILHKSVVNFLQSMQSAPGLSPHDTLLAVTTLSFDIAALELFLPLTVGAKLVIASQNTDPQQLIVTLERQQISVMQATPATWRLLWLAGWQGNSGLKALCGGEALDADLARQLIERVGQVWNLYGPTETTIWSAAHQVELEEIEQNTISIGRPIANTQFHILDAQLQPVPMGVAGELYISGMGVAQGYWNRPDLTAERFIPSPFEPSARLYKTGDRMRYRPDGTLDYLGRSDDQVKLRGFRIELGEIEATLRQAPNLQQAVVVVQPDADRLIAYLTLDDAGHDSPSLDTSLRTFLAAKLPHYMMPAVFVPLKTFPLTPNGKIDRRALPRPENHRPVLENAYVMPQTTAEQTIAQIWQRILNLEQIGIHDNFFDLGGHSLLLVKAHSQLRAQFPDLSLLDLFRYPTVSSLAAHLSQSSSASQPPPQAQPQLQAGKARQQRRRQLITSHPPFP